MAITVKEIIDKEFSRQVRGYNTDEVDDFLDAVASQLEMLIRENRALKKLVEEGGTAGDQPVQVVTAPAPVEPAPLPVPEPVVVAAPAVVEPAPIVPVEQKAPEMIGDEPTYFKNLETTLRETLISAQRIADDTVSEARKKANVLVHTAEDKASKLLSDAEEQANAILATSKVEAETVRSENAEIRRAAEDYRARFIRLVEDQMHVLKSDGSMFE